MLTADYIHTDYHYLLASFSSLDDWNAYIYSMNIYIEIRNNRENNSRFYRFDT